MGTAAQVNKIIWFAFSAICRQFSLYFIQFIQSSFNAFVFVTDFYVCVHELNLGRNVFECLARLAWVVFFLAETRPPAPSWHYINSFCFIILTYMEGVCVKWRTPHIPGKHVLSLFDSSPAWSSISTPCELVTLMLLTSSIIYSFLSRTILISCSVLHPRPSGTSPLPGLPRSPSSVSTFLTSFSLLYQSLPVPDITPPSWQSRGSDLCQDDTPAVTAQPLSNRLLNSC